MLYANSLSPSKATLAMLLLFHVTCYGDSERTPQEAPGPPRGNLDSFHYVIMGIRENRNKLNTGIFRAYGMESTTYSSKGGNDSHKPLEIYCAVDRPRGMIRFDRALPTTVFLKEPERKKTTRQTTDTDSASQRTRVNGLVELKDTHKTKLIITPSEALALSTVQKRGSLRVYAPQQRSFKEIDGKPFDVRSLGLYYWIDFHGYKQFEEIYDVLASIDPKTIDRNPDGIWRITWNNPPPMETLQQTVWVDEPRGFTVIRSETLYPRGRVKDADSLTPWLTSEVTWELYDDIWVPKTFKLDKKSSNQFQSISLSFKWEAVNKPVPEMLFRKEGLDIQDLTLVVNMTTGQPVIEEVLNDRQGYFGQSKVDSGGPTHFKTRPAGRSWPYRLLLLNTIIVTILCLLIYVRHRRRRTVPRL